MQWREVESLDRIIFEMDHTLRNEDFKNDEVVRKEAAENSPNF
jgi:hypothetical protein